MPPKKPRKERQKEKDESIPSIPSSTVIINSKSTAPETTNKMRTRAPKKTAGSAPPESSLTKPLRIAFIHPDLGIGGAERLVVDAAVGLQSHGHNVHIYTSHHDPSHCFQETRDGTLKVTVYGDWIPRHVFGKFFILFTILRGLYLALRLVLWDRAFGKFDVLFVDQLSISIPILRLLGAKILFYCHFPDKLLTTRTSFLKRLYRGPVDYLEEKTTSMAHEIVVNSKFTAGVFHDAFPSISNHPQVIYPSIQLKAYDKKVDKTDVTVKPLITSKQTILSINRFERKKNIPLAIHAFAQLRKKLPTKEFSKLRLIIAGGYDTRVLENVQHHEELNTLATETYGLETYTLFSKSIDSNTVVPECTQVLFIPSFNEAQRTYLFASASVLVYTPSNEHFGIVPVEAMYAGLPVIAVNNGGPTESVVDGVTGYLCEDTPDEFCVSMHKVISMGEEGRREMGINGREHVEGMFGDGVFVHELEKVMSGNK